MTASVSCSSVFTAGVLLVTWRRSRLQGFAVASIVGGFASVAEHPVMSVALRGTAPTLRPGP